MARKPWDTSGPPPVAKSRREMGRDELFIYETTGSSKTDVKYEPSEFLLSITATFESFSESFSAIGETISLSWTSMYDLEQEELAKRSLIEDSSLNEHEPGFPQPW